MGGDQLSRHALVVLADVARRARIEGEGNPLLIAGAVTDHFWHDRFELWWRLMGRIRQVLVCLRCDFGRGMAGRSWCLRRGRLRNAVASSRHQGDQASNPKGLPTTASSVADGVQKFGVNRCASQDIGGATPGTQDSMLFGPVLLPCQFSISYTRDVRWCLLRAAHPVGDVAVGNEASCAGGRSRPLRLTGALLLVVTSLYLGYGVSPLMESRCGCLHGPEVPCDCPHHGESKSGSHPPPCHIHAKSKAPASHALPAPGLRNRCGVIHPDLILLALVSIPLRQQASLELSPIAVPRLFLTAPPGVFIYPSKHPPKAQV